MKLVFLLSSFQLMLCMQIHLKCELLHVLPLLIYPLTTLLFAGLLAKKVKTYSRKQNDLKSAASSWLRLAPQRKGGLKFEETKAKPKR